MSKRFMQSDTYHMMQRLHQRVIASASTGHLGTTKWSLNGVIRWSGHRTISTNPTPSQNWT